MQYNITYLKKLIYFYLQIIKTRSLYGNFK
jgi:hypothetical protein